MVFFGEARWKEAAADLEHGAPRRLQAARVAADHAAPARRAGRPLAGGRAHPAAVLRQRQAPRALARAGRPRRGAHRRHVGRRQQVPAARDRRRRRRRRDPPRHGRLPVAPLQAGRAQGARRGLVLRRRRHRVHGRPRPRSVRGHGLVRRPRRRRCRQRRRQGRPRRWPASAARCRADTCAPTPPSSASASSCSSSGSCCCGASSDGPRLAGLPDPDDAHRRPGRRRRPHRPRPQAAARAGQARRAAGQRPHRRAQHLAARRVRQGRRRLPVRHHAPVDRAVGHLLAPRRRRHLAAPGRAHRHPLPAGDARRRPAPRREAVPDVAAHPRSRRDGELPQPRPLRLLHLLRDRARADVLPHRRLGLRQPRLRGHEVLHLHDVRLGVHARRHRRHGVPGSQQRRR